MALSGDIKQGVCDVHSLVKKDHAERLVRYCSICDAWICDDCAPDLALRTRAFAIKANQRLFGGRF